MIIKSNHIHTTRTGTKKISHSTSHQAKTDSEDALELVCLLAQIDPYKQQTHILGI